MRGRQYTLVRFSWQLLALTALAVFLAGCGASTSKRKQLLDDTLGRYGSLIRWGDFAGASRFLDPAIDKSKAPTALDMARYENLRVSSYTPQPIQPGKDENHIVQPVRISLYNRFTNRERTILDTQHWRYDEASERWFLTSGLPKVTRQ